MKQNDEGRKDKKFGHALVVGVERPPRRVIKSMSKKKIDRKSRLKPFVKFVNYNHLMPTRFVMKDDLEFKTVVTDPTGKEQYNEVIIAKGSMPLKQTAEMGQTKRHLEIEVKEGRVYLRTRSNSPANDEKPRENSEPLPKHLISGALAEQFAVENWNALMAGETVYAQMAIMEVREILNFKFWKREVMKFNGREVMVVMLKPSSFFVSLIVDPIALYIDTKEKKMIHYIGRTPMWKTVDGSLKALDAEIVFE